VSAQDFKLIASVINGIRCRTESAITPAYIAVVFADRLEQTHYRFDADRFLTACGLTPEERAALKR
jgi:hypothetical protein